MTEAEWLASSDPGIMLQQFKLPGGRSFASGHAPVNHFPISDRKLRLFACACWRTRAAFIDRRPYALEVADLAERVADGLPLPVDRPRHEACDYHPLSPDATSAARGMLDNDPYAKPDAALLRCINGNPFRPVALPQAPDGGPPAEAMAAIGLVRRRPGTPHLYERATRCPWLTSDVLAIAGKAYGDRLPDGALDPAACRVLSDALEEAGCEAEEECKRCKGVGSCHERPEKWKPGAKAIEVGGWVRCPVCDGNGTIPHPLLAHLRSPGPHYRGCWCVDCILGKS